MKQLLSILSFVACSLTGFGQTLPGFPAGLPIQGLGANGNTVWTRNIHSASAGFAWYGTFADTTEANTMSFLKDIAGMTIRTGNTLWIRNVDKTQWLSFGAGTTNVATTPSISLGGDGSLANPLTANLTVSPQNGNSLQIFPDGVYAPSFIENGRISGGLIVFEQNLDYTVTAAKYAIANIRYSSDETGITLSAADPTFDRIDLVAVDINGNVVVIEGTPSDDPQQPSYDPETQLPLSFILVTAASTEPVYCRDSIYFPNNGNTWTGAVSNPSRINLTSTNNPYSVTQDIEFTLAQNGDQLRLTKATVVNLGTYSVLVLKIRSKATWAATSRLVLRFYNVLTPLGIDVVIGDGIFGFNSSITNAYQTIVIPLSNFGSVVNPDNLLFTVSTTSNNTIGLYADNIELLGCEGAPIPETGNFWQVGGNRQGTTLVGGSLDNFPVQLKANNSNHTNLQVGGTTWMQGTNPGISFQLGTFANSDYFIRRIANTLTFAINTGAIIDHRISGTSVYSLSAANGNLWNSSAGAFQMQLNSTGNLLLGTNANNATTILNVSSTTKASHPFPTMTTAQKNAIVSPQEGDLVYDDDLDAYYYYDAGWQPFGGQVTASNGLSISAGSNVVLGGSALTANTSILTSAFSLTINSSAALATLLLNNSSGSGLYATAANNTAVIGESTSAAGGSFSSTTSAALTATTSTSGVPAAQFLVSGSTTNTVIPVLELRRFTSGTAAANIGGSIEYQVERSDGGFSFSNSIGSRWTDPALLTRTSQLVVTGVNNAVTGTILTIAGDGSMTLGVAYQGLGAGYLAVSNTGQVTWSAGGGGGGGDALTSNPLSQFAATTSAQLAGVISDETGTGLLVFATSPTLVTPVLGTPTSVTLTNATGLPIATGISGLGTNVATALAVNVGSAGAFVTFNGAGGTPSSLTLTNATGLPIDAGTTGTLPIARGGTGLTTLGTAGQFLRVNAGATGYEFATVSGSGTLTTISVATANGFAGSVANPTTTPVITLNTTATGIMQGNGSSISAIANSSTAGQILRVTGAATYSWGALDLADADAVTGVLLPANGGTGFSGSTANGQLLIGNGTTWSRNTLTGTANQINIANTSGNITISHAFNPTEQTLTDGATVTWNTTNGANGVLTLNGTGRTLTLTNMISGYTYTLRLIQGAGGSKTITTWTNVQWQGGIQPTLSTTAGQTDIVSLYYSSNTNRFYGTIATNMN